jgi:hypothetical protein
MSAKEEKPKSETSWVRCLGTASLVFTLLAASLIWLVNKIDE